jgi:hypothetical protein
MASGIYAKAREDFLTGAINWNSDTIKVFLIDAADYTVNLATDANLATVAVAARIGAAQTLASKSATDGIADAADITFPSVTGDPAEAILIYKDTGNESTSRLIAYIDQATSGLPVTPNGGNITVQWDNGANKIFKL